MGSSAKPGARSRGHMTSFVRTCSLMRRAKLGLEASSTGTAITPETAQARKEAIHSAQLGLQRRTASPLAMLRASNSRASWVAVSAMRDRTSARGGIHVEKRRQAPIPSGDRHRGSRGLGNSVHLSAHPV